MSIIEEVGHSTGHGLGAAKDTLSKPFEAFAHASPRTKMMIVGAVAVAVIGYWYFFLRGKSAGAANGSTSTAGYPVGGGAGSLPYQTGNSTTNTRETINNYYNKPPKHTGKRKPGKHKTPAKHPNHHPSHIRLPGRHGNGHTIPHPVPLHGGVSNKSFLQALGIVRKERAQVKTLRRERQRVGPDTRRGLNLQKRIHRDRRVIMKNRNTVITYRHPNKPGYLINMHGKPNHATKGTRQHPNRKRAA